MFHLTLRLALCHRRSRAYVRATVFHEFTGNNSNGACFLRRASRLQSRPAKHLGGLSVRETARVVADREDSMRHTFGNRFHETRDKRDVCRRSSCLQLPRCDFRWGAVEVLCVGTREPPWLSTESSCLDGDRRGVVSDLRSKRKADQGRATNGR